MTRWQSLKNWITVGREHDIPLCCAVRFAVAQERPHLLRRLAPELHHRLRNVRLSWVVGRELGEGCIPCEYHALKWILTGRKPTVSQDSNMERPTAKLILDPVPLWRYYRGPASGEWVAACDSLKQTASGEDFPDMVGCVAEIMESLIQDLLEEGDLDTYMAEHGIKVEDRDIPECESHYDLVIVACWNLEPES